MSLKVIKEENPKTGKREVEILLPNEEINDMYQKSLKDLKREAHIKGFRKGKAPVEVIEKMYGPQAKREVVVDLIKEKVGQYLSDYFYVKTEPVKERNEDEGIVASFSFEYLPQLEGFEEVLKGLDFSGREVKKTLKEDLEGYAYHELMQRAQQNEYLDKVEEPVKYGDYVILKTCLIGQKSGKQISEDSMQFVVPHNEKQWEFYLSKLDPEKQNISIIKNIPGKKPGETFSSPFEGDEFIKTSQWDEPWVVEASIQEVYRLSPEKKEKLKEEGHLTFDYEKIDEIFPEMEATLQISAYKEENKKIADEVIEELVEHYKDKVAINVDIMERKMKEVEEKTLDEISRRFYETKPVLVKDLAYPDKFRETVKENALKGLLVEIIYATIQKKYNIEVNENDIEHQLRMIAMQNGLKVSDVQKHVEEKQLYSSLYQQLTIQKVLGYLENEFGIQPPKAEKPDKDSSQAEDVEKVREADTEEQNKEPGEESSKDEEEPESESDEQKQHKNEEQ